MPIVIVETIMMRWIAGILTVAALTFSPSVEAKTQGSFGLLGGIIFSTRSSSTFGFGASFAYKMKKRWGWGAFVSKYGIGLTTTRTEEDDSTSKISNSISEFAFGGEGILFLRGGLKNMQVALKLGFSIIDNDASAKTNAIDTNIDSGVVSFFFGPRIGYDHRLGRFSVGGDISYIFGLASDAPNVIYFMSAFKFWF